MRHSSSHLNFNFCKDLEDWPHCLHGNSVCMNISVSKADPNGKLLKWMEKIRGKQPGQAECQEHQTQEVKSGALTSPSKGHPEQGKMAAVVLLIRVFCVIFQRTSGAIYYLCSQDCS